MTVATDESAETSIDIICQRSIDLIEKTLSDIARTSITSSSAIMDVLLDLRLEFEEIAGAQN